MGTQLQINIKKDLAVEANAFLHALPQYIKYKEQEYNGCLQERDVDDEVLNFESFGFWFYTEAMLEKDIEWCDTEDCGNPEYFKEYFPDQLGKCEIPLANETYYDELMPLLVEILTLLTTKYEVAYAFNDVICENSSYLTVEQIKRITKRGELIDFQIDENSCWQDQRLKMRFLRLMNRDDFLALPSTLEPTSKQLSTQVHNDFFANNKNFYPTPKHLVERMLMEIDFNRPIKNVLEPSAGKGDIINVCKEYTINFAPSRFNRDVMRYKSVLENADYKAIELDPDLQALLRGNGITVIDSDFLSFNGADMFDLIIMNPPFDQGDKHLHKALDIMFSGQIVCLLNAQTIKNPCTNERKRLLKRLEELDADIEFIDAAFSDAQRSTDVETALVYVNIIQEVESTLFKDMTEDHSSSEEYVHDSYEVAGMNKIRNLVIEYNRERQLVIDQIVAFYKNYNKVGKYLKLFVRGEEDESSYSRQEAKTLTETMNQKVNKLSIQLKNDYWRQALDLEEVKSRLTSHKRRQIDRELEAATSMEFTEQNVRQFIIHLIEKYPLMIQEAVKYLFHEFTRHAIGNGRYETDYIGNIHYFNGWKTNNAYRVNKKVIMPFYIRDWDYNNKISWEQQEMLSDIDRVMAYFDASAKLANTGTICNEALDCGQNRKIDTPFFYISIFKKGTIHFEFKDMDLLRRFNIEACIGESFIPHDYSTKPYEHLNEDEKELVDNFEGAKEYKQISNTLQISTRVLDNYLLEDKHDEVSEDEESTTEPVNNETYEEEQLEAFATGTLFL